MKLLLLRVVPSATSSVHVSLSMPCPYTASPGHILSYQHSDLLHQTNPCWSSRSSCGSTPSTLLWPPLLCAPLSILLILPLSYVHRDLSSATCLPECRVPSFQGHQWCKIHWARSGRQPHSSKHDKQHTYQHTKLAALINSRHTAVLPRLS